MAEKIKLTISEQIDRAKDGRSQAWIVRQLIKRGFVITEVLFSRKKKGFLDFTEDELAAISEILSVEIR